MEGPSSTPIHTPYYVPTSQLPAPLPTIGEIIDSNDVLRGDSPWRRVVGVGPYFVVKYGPGVCENEGQALLFLEKQLGYNSIVPKLYAMYILSESKSWCLVMQRLQGDSLETAWPALSEADKTTICATVKAFIDMVHEFPTQGFFGSVARGPLPHHIFYSDENDYSICGPFSSEGDLNASLIKKLRDNWISNKRPTVKADFYDAHLNNILHGHRPVFTHSDIQKKNILIRRTGSLATQFEISIVDWEDAGWYPEYWEYAVIFATLEWSSDWPMRFEQMISPWLVPAVILRMLYQELFW